MNASAVKPSLPTGGVQAPKVGLGAPPAAANSSPAAANVSPPKLSSLPNTSGSPTKPTAPVNINHVPLAAMPLPLSLVQEHKPPTAPTVNQPPPPQPPQQPPLNMLRPEKKEYPFVPAPVVKPTSNGVEGSPNKTNQTPTPLPVEVKKSEEESAALPVQNHSVEPAKHSAPPMQPSVVPPPAPVVTAAPTDTSQLPLQASPAKLEPEMPVSNDHSSKLEEESKPAPVPAVVPVETPPAVSSPVAPAPPPAVVSPSQLAAPTVDNTAKPVSPTEAVKTRPDAAKPEFKVATPPRNNKRKKEVKTPEEGKASTSDEDGRKPKRTRTRTQPYQSPNPELMFIAKTIKTLTKSPDDKLIVFYKNEFLAVRNSEGGFYICQAMQNIYKTSPKIRIRWLSQEKKDNKTEVYIPDFYDFTDFDCILTNLEMKKMDKNRFQLPAIERERTQNILKRALDVEKGVSEKSPVTEEHPDGLDLSLYRDESQLKKRKKGSKRSAKKKLAFGSSESGSDEDEDSDEGSSDESGDDEKESPAVKLSSKRAEKPRAAVKAKEADKRAERASEREKRASTSKRRSEPVTPTPTARTARPSPEKKAKPAVAVKQVKKAEPVAESSPPTRSTKTRGVKSASPAKSSPATRTKEREPRKSATPPVAKGRKKSAGKKA